MNDETISAVMRELGSRTSIRKRESSRRNGQKAYGNLPDCTCGKPKKRHLDTCERLIAWKRGRHSPSVAFQTP